MSHKWYFQSILSDDAQVDFSPGALIDADNNFTINATDLLVVNQYVANEVDLPTNEVELKKYLSINNDTPMPMDFDQMYLVYTNIKNNNYEYQQKIFPLISRVTTDLWSFTIQITEILTYASSLLDDIRTGKSPESSTADLKEILLTLVKDEAKTNEIGTEYYNNKLKILLRKLNRFFDVTTQENASVTAIQKKMKEVFKYNNVKLKEINKESTSINEMTEQISAKIQNIDIIKMRNNKTNVVQGLSPDKQNGQINQMKAGLSSKQELYQRDAAVSDLLQRVKIQSSTLSEQMTIIMKEFLKIKETWDTIQSSVNTIVALDNSVFLDPLSNVSLKRAFKVAAHLWGNIRDSIKIFTEIAHIQPPKSL